MSRILVIDNYDSFVYTIVGYLDQLGAETVVMRNDAVPPLAERTGFDGVLVSPGPGTPAEAGASISVIRDCAATGTPMLGVCLGHQALGEVFGGTVTHAPELMHGKTSLVEHDGQGVLAGLPSPFTATRYHSLAVVDGTVSDELVVTARANGIIMGLQHRTLPLHGVQFHPESVLTEGGHRLLANWLALTGDPAAVDRAAGLHPLVRH
ncbi:MAG TPA: aminodeoxychorismate/anthranilate synthase component II [Cellulomonas sp.]